jgi:hypothetical protein
MSYQYDPVGLFKEASKQNGDKEEMEDKKE